jgi:hypothetical protein
MGPTDLPTGVDCRVWLEFSDQAADIGWQSGTIAGAVAPLADGTQAAKVVEVSPLLLVSKGLAGPGSPRRVAPRGLRSLTIST